MNFPLNFWDITFLTALIAIILLVTTEILSSYSGKVSILIDKKKLRTATVIMIVTCLVTAFLRIVDIIITSP